MVRRPPTKSSILIAAALLVALVAWTWLTFAFGPVQALDARWVAPPLDPLSPVAQIAAAFSLLTWPGVTYAAVAGIAIWAFQRRLRQLAVALGLMISPLGATPSCSRSPSPGRARSGLDLITVSGYAYPSSHMSSIVAGAHRGRRHLRGDPAERQPAAAVAGRRRAARAGGGRGPVDHRRALHHRHRRRGAARRPDRDARPAGQRGRGAGGVRPGHRDDPDASRRTGTRPSGGGGPR